ncbi:hypothetical protein KIL84_023469 [Mauremys mutica]|uniref:Uncharacterized protein n=1 Tax=Mauremys mutica TaxID=74926 RepID=A0A9D3WSH4_9SAUR|nr:hypothetical protein KIL84_023469 [Mauremys mutica]
MHAWPKYDLESSCCSSRVEQNSALTKEQLALQRGQRTPTIGVSPTPHCISCRFLCHVGRWINLMGVACPWKGIPDGVPHTMGSSTGYMGGVNQSHDPALRPDFRRAEPPGWQIRATSVKQPQHL